MVFLEVWLILVREVVIFVFLFFKLGLKYQIQTDLIQSVDIEFTVYDYKIIQLRVN